MLQHHGRSSHNADQCLITLPRFHNVNGLINHIGCTSVPLLPIRAHSVARGRSYRLMVFHGVTWWRYAPPSLIGEHISWVHYREKFSPTWDRQVTKVLLLWLLRMNAARILYGGTTSSGINTAVIRTQWYITALLYYISTLTYTIVKQDVIYIGMTGRNSHWHANWEQDEMHMTLSEFVK